MVHVCRSISSLLPKMMYLLAIQSKSIYFSVQLEYLISYLLVLSFRHVP